MKDKEPLTPDTSRRMGFKVDPSFLSLLCAVLLVLVVAQGGSFFFLFGRLEEMRGRLETATLQGGRGETLASSEIQTLKSRVDMLTEDCDGTKNTHNHRKTSPPHPPPSKPSLKSLGSLGSLESQGRVKRRASDPSYGVNGALGEVRGEDGELSVQLQGEDSTDRSEVDRSWLQLTSYAKLPFEAIQDFCARTRASCPPGPAGLRGPSGEPGEPGQDGERGDRGLPGQVGPLGPKGGKGEMGPTGVRGPKGEIGLPGIPGLDGRDGLPGEPGLDGIPGRNGMNGIHGIDGIPGINGATGRDGVNGTDGTKGVKGDRGPRGPQGSRGIAGPKGRKGKDGTPGEPGTPGISTYMINNATASKLLIAPSIPGSHRSRRRGRRPIIVREGENLRLRCQAAGVPQPEVEWTREDGGVIPIGRYMDGSLVGRVLNLTGVHRDHTGTYTCEAYNGIPPNDSKTFYIEVHFDPFIKTKQWKVGAHNSTREVLMECDVEAFPMAVTYWEDEHGNLLENSTKYSIFFYQDPNSVWKSVMTIKVYNIERSDFGGYYCVAKNELSITRGLVRLYEIDPSRHHPLTGTLESKTYGAAPPNFTDYYDLCPPPAECQECPKATRCAAGRGALYGIRVEQFGNDTYPGFRNRTTDCKLSAVGKPVYHRHTDSNFGSWMRDPYHPTGRPRDPRFWTTDPNHPEHLYEFPDKNRYRKNHLSKNYTLPSPFVGNSHVVYNGSFYYHQQGHQRIIRYDLLTETMGATVHVPQVATEGNNFLYQVGKDYIDFNTDDNGLWAVYGLPSNNNTVVMKLDPWSLKVEYSWNIPLSHKKFGELFIACGVMYAIDSSTSRDTKIRFAFDLYHNELLDVELIFNNPFRMTTMLGYNYDTEEIYSWDSGNQLTYPVKLNALESVVSEEEHGGGEAT